MSILISSSAKSATLSNTKAGEASEQGLLFALWLLGITLLLTAIWLLVTSMTAEWLIGLIVGATWICTILFNSCSLSYLLRRTKRPTRVGPIQERLNGKSFQFETTSPQPTG